LAASLLAAAFSIPAAASAHPLDALSAAEIGAALSVLRAAGHADAARADHRDAHPILLV